MELKRFIVKCMFQVSYYRPGGIRLDRSSWVERVFYLRAADTEASYRKAEELSYEYECDFTDRDGVYVCCRLYEITDSYELTEERLQDKTELYHNFFDASAEEVEWILRRQYGEKSPES